MILILEPNSAPESTDYKILSSQLDRLPGITYRVHREVSAEVTPTEIYLIGNTGADCRANAGSALCLEGGAGVGSLPRPRAPQARR
jgi:hypothetical protein